MTSGTERITISSEISKRLNLICWSFTAILSRSRASIYSTNMIESFNNVIKRKAKPKAEFPTEQSLDTFIGIQAMSYNERYFNRIHKGFGQVQDTLESYFD